MYISKLNIFFLCDGKTCLRRAYINGAEQIVEAEIGATFSQDIRKLRISVTIINSFAPLQ